MTDRSPRCVIVNADDFGLSTGTNQGIIDAHERGIVTSTSLMVRQPAAEEAARYARANTDFAVGLHFDLGEWQLGSDGKWEPIYQVVDVKDREAVRSELLAQLRKFRELIGKNPTHLDSHQHAHKHEPAAGLLRAAGIRLRVPVRHFSPRVRYCGEFFGRHTDGTPRLEAISAQGLTDLISTLPRGTTELCCHPGDDVNLASSYLSERQIELASLTSPAIKRALREANVRLISFAQVRPRRSPTFFEQVKRVFLRGLDA